MEPLPFKQALLTSFNYIMKNKLAIVLTFGFAYCLYAQIAHVHSQPAPPVRNYSSALTVGQVTNFIAQVAFPTNVTAQISSFTVNVNADGTGNIYVTTK